MSTLANFIGRVTGSQSKIQSGDTLLVKAKRYRAELASSYSPLLIKVVPSYPDIDSGKSGDEIQAHFLSPNSGTSTPSAADSADKLVDTLKEANNIERERFETDKNRYENAKEVHDIKIAETKLKNFSVMHRNPPASLSEAQI